MIQSESRVLSHYVDVLVAFFLLFVVFLVISGLKVVIDIVGLNSVLFPWALAVPQILIFMYVWWLVRTKKSTLKWKEMGFRFPEEKKYFTLAVCLVPINLLVAFIYALFVVNLGIEKIVPPQIPSNILGTGWIISINLIVITMWVPMIEETFFRGYLLTRLLKGMGIFGSIIATSLVFALMHGHLGLWAPVFINSCFISVLFIKSGSLYPVVLCHGLQNFVVALVAASA